MNTNNFLFFVIMVSYITCNKSFYITDEEVSDILKLSSTNFDFDVVPVVHTLHRRDVDPTLKIRAFQRNLKLYLESETNYLFGKYTPVYLASTDANSRTNIKYTRFQHNLDFQVYHDKVHNATLMIQRNNGSILVNGIIGNLLIRPIPQNLNHEIRKNRNTNFTDSFLIEDEEIYTTDHMIAKLEKDYKNYRTKRSLFDTMWNFFEWRKTNEEVVEVFPEILVTTDFKTFEDHGKNIEEFIKYMVVFWNGVDLKYRIVEKPKIRLNIAGLIIPQDEEAAPYITSHLYNNDTLLSNRVLDSVGKYFYSNSYFLPDIFDMVVALTNYKMSARRWLGNAQNIGGITNFAGACQSSFWFQSMDAVAIINDDSQFSGIYSAAHELAHLMGASHDGEESENNNIPGGEACRSSGYIMSSYHTDERSQRWSDCSLNSMNAFLQSDQSSCLRNRPTAINLYPSFLPGNVASLKEQCDAFEKGSIPCNDGQNSTLGSVCHRMYCGISGENCHYVGAALEGSPCNGYKGICIIGDCVPLLN